MLYSTRVLTHTNTHTRERGRGRIAKQWEEGGNEKRVTRARKRLKPDSLYPPPWVPVRMKPCPPLPLLPVNDVLYQQEQLHIKSFPYVLMEIKERNDEIHTFPGLPHTKTLPTLSGQTLPPLSLLSSLTPEPGTAAGWEPAALSSPEYNNAGSRHHQSRGYFVNCLCWVFFLKIIISSTIPQSNCWAAKEGERERGADKGENDSAISLCWATYLELINPRDKPAPV